MHECLPCDSGTNIKELALEGLRAAIYLTNGPGRPEVAPPLSWTTEIALIDEQLTVFAMYSSALWPTNVAVDLSSFARSRRTTAVLDFIRTCDTLSEIKAKPSQA